VSPNEQSFASQNTPNANDFTTGLVFGNGVGAGYGYSNTGFSPDNNSNVVAILMDLTTYANGDQTINVGHQKNPKQVKYLSAKTSTYNPINPQQNPLTGGVDQTGVYRDPWGNPYVITMNTSYSMDASSGYQGTSDLLYCFQAVSQITPGTQGGYNGLSNPNAAAPNSNNFLFHGKVMVWSAGPDGKYDNTIPAITGVNKDNVLSWR
jgi:hypothetical protein